jgi:hypothetical protein
MNIDAILEAGRVVLQKRQELADAEARFATLAGMGMPGYEKRRGRPPSVVTAAKRAAPRATPAGADAATATDDLPVAQQVAKLFESDKKYIFSDILEAVGGREKKFAVKSALNKLRAKKLVKFANGFYSAK